MGKDALMILAKYPMPGHAKTRLIPSLGEITASQISEFFLVDILNRFNKEKDLKIVIVGTPRDSKDDFHSLLLKHGINENNVEIFNPGTGKMETDILAAYLHVLATSHKAIVTASDIPYLSVAMVKRLLKTLDDCDLVFHPNIDGTTCPHGMKKPIDLFSGMNSRSDQWLKLWHQKIVELGVSYKMFEPLFDIDRFDDLLTFYHWQVILRDSKNHECFCPATMMFLDSILGSR